MIKNFLLKQLLLSCLAILGTLSLSAQESVHATGGEATGTGGTMSYSVGQVSFEYRVGADGSLAEGVQQPFEIWVTSVNDLKSISLQVEAYPNPTKGELWLSVDNPEQGLRYQLFDFNGKLIDSDVINLTRTQINLDNYAAATYFLRVSNQQTEIKTFKIIKN